MSLSIEIRVNGHPVAVVDAHNTGSYLGEDINEYEARSVHFRLDAVTTDVAKFRLAHRYDDGILILAAKLLNQAADAAKGKTK